MAKKQSVEVHLDYYKQGDDLQDFLEKRKGHAVKALRDHAENMAAVSEHLSNLADEIEKSGAKIKIEAGTHYIGFECSPDLAELLIEKGLADESGFEEDEEN